MAITTYIFNPQQIHSGEMIITMKSSHGVGGEIPCDDDAYFSDEITITRQSESDGGDLSSDVASFVIENDVNNLFESTIFSSLNEVGGWVSLQLKIDGKIVFSGVISKESIRYSTDYEYGNRVSTSTVRKISFSCIWYFELLKNISGDELGRYIRDNVDLHISYPKLSRNYTGIGSGTKVVTFINLLYSCISKLSELYGITFSVSFDIVKYNFYTRSNGEYVGFRYQYPPVGGTPVEQLSSATYDEYDNVQIASAGILLTNGQNLLTGYFEIANEKYIGNAYDFFVGVLRSFALILTVKTNGDYDVCVSIGTRSSGKYVEKGDVLEQSDDLYSDIARDGVDIKSYVCGNQYKKDFNTSADSIYSNENKFDFNSADMGGGNDSEQVMNSRYSALVHAPTIDSKGTFLLLRRLGIGDCLLNNPNFSGSLIGWDTTDFTQQTSNGIGYAYTVGQHLTAKTISQSFAEGSLEQENYMFSCRVYCQAPFTVGLNWYRKDENGDDVFWSGTIFDLESVTGENRLFVSEVDDIIPSKVELSVFVQNEADAGLFDIFVSNARMYLQRKNTEEIYGKMIEKYFNNNAVTRKRYVMNGVKYNYSVSDFVEHNNENYYLKSIKMDLANNETEIEAINYPY